MIWPAEMLERARQMWDDGYTAGQIGVAIGKTRNAVIGQAHRRGWNARGPDSPLKGLIRKRYIRRPRPTPEKRPRKVRSDGFNIIWTLKPPKIVKPVPVEPSRETACTLLALRAISCRFPVDEAAGRDQLFCGAGKEFKHTYCEYHRMRAYGRGTESERRAHEVAA